MKLRDTLITLAVIGIVGIAVLIWVAPWEGDKAPGVTFTTLEGDSVQLADLRGAPQLITFWATDCVTCVQEIPHLRDLHAEFSGEGFNVIAIAMSHDQRRQVEAMAEDRSLNYPIVLDSDGSLARAFGDVRLTPTTFLISPRGNILQRRLGMFDEEQMRRQIRQLLDS